MINHLITILILAFIAYIVLRVSWCVFVIGNMIVRLISRR